jgi:dihydropteroate synthase
MQQNPKYEDITKEIIFFFAEQIEKLHQLKVNDIIIDLGFGFGKTIDHNFEILKKLELFKSLNAPILAGISRKSMLYKPLGISAQEALNATTCANTIALIKWCNYFASSRCKRGNGSYKNCLSNYITSMFWIPFYEFF